ncbi:MAG: hypothetical protein ACI4TK_13900 [Agathobacter sp.]
MDTITQYLKDVATLECQVNTQDRLIEQLNQRSYWLGWSKEYREPVLNTNYEKPSSIACAFFFLLGCAIWFYLLYKFLSPLPKGALSHLPDFVPILTMSLPLWWWIPLFYLPYRTFKISSQKRYNKDRYKKELARYRETLEQDRQRVNQELTVKNDLNCQVQQVQQTKSNTLHSLNQLYSLNIIHPKYRNFVAISSFYDYFDTGRCTSLTGPGGAYDTFEYEKRFGIIITQLDSINQKLDDIIDNQQCICDLLREANSTL